MIRLEKFYGYVYILNIIFRFIDILNIVIIHVSIY